MARTREVLGNWNLLIEGFNASAKEFYEQVSIAVKNRGMDNTKISEVTWSEGGILSAKRLYLRVQRGPFAFDICGAPFGKGFFFSWWFAEMGSFFSAIKDAILALPVVGPFFTFLFRPDTYYKLDTEGMFRASVQAAVNEVIDGMREKQGLRALSEEERKPRLRQLQK